MLKLAGERCPHLVHQLDRDGSLAICTIHHLHCYRGTPCELFDQLGPEDAVCVMSGYLRALAEK